MRRWEFGWDSRPRKMLRSLKIEGFSLLNDFSLYHGGFIDEPGPLAPIDEWHDYCSRLASLVVHPDLIWWKRGVVESAYTMLAAQQLADAECLQWKRSRARVRHKAAKKLPRRPRPFGF